MVEEIRMTIINGQMRHISLLSPNEKPIKNMLRHSGMR